ncbi:recombinase family protein [Acidobacteriota bacterium]
MSEYCVMYCRVSTRDQEEHGLSLDAQEDVLRAYADEESYVIIKSFRGNESAKAPGRKLFNAMLDYCKENEIHHVLVENLDRLHRNKQDELTIDKFIEYGGIVHRVGERIVRDKDTDIEDQTIDEMKGVFTRHERKKIAKRVRYAQGQMLKRGEPPFTPPLGYKSISRDKEKGRPRMIVQSDDAPKVKEFLQIFHDKKFSLSQMLKVAKDIGLKSVRGAELVRREDVARIIRYRFYYGEFEFVGKVYPIKIQGYKPIISKKLWEENQEILATRARYKKPEEKLRFRYNNLINCGRCGRLFYGIQPVHRTKWEKKDGTISEKEYKYSVKYLCTKEPWYTDDGFSRIPEEYVDKQALVVKKDMFHDPDDYEYDSKTDDWIKVKPKLVLKKGTKVKKLKCDMPTFEQSEIEDIIYNEISAMKFNDKAWKEMKDKLFRDETKEFLDYEIQTTKTEITKSETRREKLYDDYSKDIITADFVATQMKKIDAHIEERKVRLEELEEERSRYDEKIGKSIQIIDNLKSWHEKWEKASDEKKNEMLRLMTVKISSLSHKTEVDGKEHHWKELYIVYNEEFNRLFELGLFELPKKKKRNNPSSGGGGSRFNCSVIKYGSSDIGGFRPNLIQPFVDVDEGRRRIKSDWNENIPQCSLP